MRGNTGRCKPEGLLYDPKPDMFKQLLQSYRDFLGEQKWNTQSQPICSNKMYSILSHLEKWIVDGDIDDPDNWQNLRPY
jgi:hypothetical protein